MYMTLFTVLFCAKTNKGCFIDSLLVLLFGFYLPKVQIICITGKQRCVFIIPQKINNSILIIYRHLFSIPPL